MTKKLAITKKQAIKECKELWAEIKASGRSKYSFLYDTPEGERWTDKHYRGGCPLCAYREAKSSIAGACSDCPLVTKYGVSCFELGFDRLTPPTQRWMKAIRRL